MRLNLIIVLKTMTFAMNICFQRNGVMVINVSVAVAKEFKGRTRYYKRCKNCRYDESVTANTVFHDMKMPLLKAFHLIFRIVQKRKACPQ